jgi:hypothetical protein
MQLPTVNKVSDVPSRDRLKRSQYSGYQFLLKERSIFINPSPSPDLFSFSNLINFLAIIRQPSLLPKQVNLYWGLHSSNGQKLRCCIFNIFKLKKHRIPVGCPRGTSERLRLQPVPV